MTVFGRWSSTPNEISLEILTLMQRAYAHGLQSINKMPMRTPHGYRVRASKYAKNINNKDVKIKDRDDNEHFFFRSTPHTWRKRIEKVVAGCVSMLKTYLFTLLIFGSISLAEYAHSGEKA